jgi:hypothetical protein
MQRATSINIGGPSRVEATLQGRTAEFRISYAIDHATEVTIHKFISVGKVEELWDLLNAMDESRA